MSDIGGEAEDGSAQAGGHRSGRSRLVQYEKDGAWVVVAHGGYGLDSLSGLADALETAAQKHSKVVLDASGVTFADSSFLNLVLGVHRLTSLRLAAPAQQLRRLLELTGADGVLAVRATVEEAVMS